MLLLSSYKHSRKGWWMNMETYKPTKSVLEQYGRMNDVHVEAIAFAQKHDGDSLDDVLDRASTTLAPVLKTVSTFNEAGKVDAMCQVFPLAKIVATYCKNELVKAVTAFRDAQGTAAEKGARTAMYSVVDRYGAIFDGLADWIKGYEKVKGVADLLRESRVIDAKPFVNGENMPLYQAKLTGKAPKLLPV